MKKETKIIFNSLLLRKSEMKKDRKKKMLKYYVNCVEFGTPK